MGVIDTSKFGAQKHTVTREKHVVDPHTKLITTLKQTTEEEHYHPHVSLAEAQALKDAGCEFSLSDHPQASHQTKANGRRFFITQEIFDTLYPETKTESGPFVVKRRADFKPGKPSYDVIETATGLAVNAEPLLRGDAEELAEVKTEEAGS